MVICILIRDQTTRPSHPVERIIVGRKYGVREVYVMLFD